MTQAEAQIIQLKETLKPVLNWYQKILDEGEPDPSYLYDTTYEVFNDNLSSGDFQKIIEILLMAPESDAQDASSSTSSAEQ